MNNEIQEQKEGITRKIKENTRYRVWRKDSKNISFYSIQLKQTLYNGDEFKYYQKIRFRKGTELENGTDIIIKRAIENDMPNPKDDYGFIREYMILDFEKVDNALKEYQDKKRENEADANAEITSDMLPF